MSAPDPQLAVARYRAHAPGYDASAARTMALRRRTVARLTLQPGQTVLELPGYGILYNDTDTDDPPVA